MPDWMVEGASRALACYLGEPEDWARALYGDEVEALLTGAGVPEMLACVEKARALLANRTEDRFRTMIDPAERDDMIAALDAYDAKVPK